MHHPLTGPFWGNIAILVLAGSFTIACFAAMLRMLVRPGEDDRRHAKYMILEDTRSTGG